MAIYSFNVNMISRGNGQNVIASAAYRSGEKLVDFDTGEVKHYSRKVQPENHILAPEHSPDWVHNREQLWNEVERSETRINSQLARSFMVALPVEFSEEEQREVVLKFAQKNFVDKGMVADIAIHRDDPNNPHAHILTTTREIDRENGFTVKNRDWNKKQLLEEWRKDWEVCCNEKLIEIGHGNQQISAASYKDRGLEYLPTLHLGYKENALKLKGIKTEKVLINERIASYNLEIKNANRQLADLQAEKNLQKVTEGKFVSQAIQKELLEKYGVAYVSKNTKTALFSGEYKDIHSAFMRYQKNTKEPVSFTNFQKHLHERVAVQNKTIDEFYKKIETTATKRDSYMKFLENHRSLLLRVQPKFDRINVLDKKIANYERKFFGLGVYVYSKNIQNALIERRGLLYSKDMERYQKFAEKHKIYNVQQLDRALHENKQKLTKYLDGQEVRLKVAVESLEKNEQLIKRVEALHKDFEQATIKGIGLNRYKANTEQKIEETTAVKTSLEAAEQQAEKEVSQAAHLVDKTPTVEVSQESKKLLEKHERLSEVVPFIQDKQQLDELIKKYDELPVIRKGEKTVFEAFTSQIKANNKKLENDDSTRNRIESNLVKFNGEVAAVKQKIEQYEKDTKQLQAVEKELEKHSGVKGKFKVLTNKETKQEVEQLHRQKTELESRLSKTTPSRLQNELDSKLENVKRMQDSKQSLKTEQQRAAIQKDNQLLEKYAAMTKPFQEQQQKITKEIIRQRDREHDLNR